MDIFFLVAAAVAGVCLFNIYKLSTVRLHSGQMVVVRAEDIPSAQADRLMDVELVLAGQGFEKLCHVQRSKVIEGQDWGAFAAVYFHSERRVYAFASVEPFANAVMGCRVYFVNVDEQGEVFVTVGGSDFSPACYPANLHVNDAIMLDHKKQWGIHQAFLRGRVEKSARFATLEPVLALFERVFFGGLVESGVMYPHDNAYRLRFKVAAMVWWRSWQVRRQLAAQKKALPDSQQPLAEGDADSLEAYQTYQRIQAGNKLGSYAKIVLLLVSVLLFAASFGWGLGFSLTTLALLIVVLFVHELGHLFGMWLFGYRDLNMLFVPFLGALAMGKKDKVNPWQEAIVLILGPLPGYILGAVLLFGGGDNLPDWVFHYAVLSLILNGVNLLPFMPLDGGRLVNLALFNKVPVLQLVFYVVSIAFFAWVGLILNERITLVFAVLLALGLPALWREVSLLKVLLRSNTHQQGTDLSAMISTVADEPVWKNMTQKNRWAALDSLVYRVQHAKAGLVASVGIMLLWIATLVLPLYAVMGDVGRQYLGDLQAVLNWQESAKESIAELEENYRTATGFDERVQYLTQLVTMSGALEMENAERYWNELNALRNDNSLSPVQRERALAASAIGCAGFEGEHCSDNYYRAIVQMPNKPQQVTYDRVEALLSLAEFGRGSREQRLEYLALLDVKETDFSNPGLFPWMLSRKADIYFSLREQERAVTSALDAVIASENQTPESTTEYIRQLVNLYVAQEQAESAIALLEEWIPKLAEREFVDGSLASNLSYIKVVVLAQVDVSAALDALQKIDLSFAAHRVELGLAELYLESRLGPVSDETVQTIIKNAEAVQEEYQWYELAINLESQAIPEQSLRSDAGRLRLLENWYGDLHKTLQMDQLSSIRKIIEDVHY